MSLTQKLKGLAADSLGLKTLNDNSYVSDSPSEEQDRPGNRICLRSSSETLPLCQ